MKLNKDNIIPLTVKKGEIIGGNIQTYKIQSIDRDYKIYVFAPEWDGSRPNGGTDTHEIFSKWENLSECVKHDTLEEALAYCTEEHLKNLNKWIN